MCWVSLPETHMQEPSSPTLCPHQGVPEAQVARGDWLEQRAVYEAGKVGLWASVPTVCNAGRGLLGPLEEHLEDDVGSVLDVNVVGTVRMLQAFLPDMKRRRSGRVLVTGSMGGLMGEWKGPGAGKWALGCLGVAGSPRTCFLARLSSLISLQRAAFQCCLLR